MATLIYVAHIRDDMKWFTSELFWSCNDDDDDKIILNSLIGEQAGEKLVVKGDS